MPFDLHAHIQPLCKAFQIVIAASQGNGFIGVAPFCVHSVKGHFTEVAIFPIEIKIPAGAVKQLMGKLLQKILVRSVFQKNTYLGVLAGIYMTEILCDFHTNNHKFTPFQIDSCRTGTSPEKIESHLSESLVEKLSEGWLSSYAKRILALME